MLLNWAKYSSCGLLLLSIESMNAFLHINTELNYLASELKRQFDTYLFLSSTALASFSLRMAIAISFALRSLSLSNNSKARRFALSRSAQSFSCFFLRASAAYIKSYGVWDCIFWEKISTYRMFLSLLFLCKSDLLFLIISKAFEYFHPDSVLGNE